MSGVLDILEPITESMTHGADVFSVDIVVGIIVFCITMESIASVIRALMKGVQ